MSIELSMLLVAILASLASSVVGVFLVLRKMSMMTDAISHTVLLGIVLAFMVVKDLSNPLLILGATLMGVMTVILVELLVKSKKTSEDAATGVVFPLLFAVAIILISLQFRGVHLDIDSVLLGNLEFVYFDQIMINGVAIGPKSFYVLLVVFLLNLGFFIFFYKELKIVSFDPKLAAVLGISPLIIHYGLMVLVSLTAVTSFDAVGSVVVIALMIGPAITALLFTKNLFKTVMLSMAIGVFNSLFGFLIAYFFDLRMSGVIAFVTLGVFILALVFNPKTGLIATIVKRRNQKIEFSLVALLNHLENHQKSNENRTTRASLNATFSPSSQATNLIDLALTKGYIECKDDTIHITEVGLKFYHDKTKTYEFEL